MNEQSVWLAGSSTAVLNIKHKGPRSPVFIGTSYRVCSLLSEEYDLSAITEVMKLARPDTSLLNCCWQRRSQYVLHVGPYRMQGRHKNNVPQFPRHWRVRAHLLRQLYQRRSCVFSLTACNSRSVLRMAFTFPAVQYAHVVTLTNNHGFQIDDLRVRRISSNAFHKLLGSGSSLAFVIQMKKKKKWRRYSAILLLRSDGCQRGLHVPLLTIRRTSQTEDT